MKVRRLVVHGIPEGKPRPRPRGSGDGFYSPKTAWDYAVQIAGAISPERPRPPLAGPLRVDIEYAMPRPKSVPLSVYHCPQKPDGDNADKSTWDGLTATPNNPRGWWRDDKQIVAWSGVKRYCVIGEKPHAVVTVTELSTPVDNLVDNS